MKRTTLFLLLIISISILFAQTATMPFSEEFDGDTFPPQNWSNVDANNDGSMWHYYEGTAKSDSMNDVLYGHVPNNWLITPAFVFQAGVNYVIEFDRKSTDDYYSNEFLSVYIMLSNDSSTCNDNLPGNTLLWADYSSINWQTITIEYSPQTTQTLFIGFRHHNCFGERSLLLDNIMVYESRTQDLGIVSLTGPVIFGFASQYTLNVRNYASQPVSAGSYSIQYYYSSPGGNPVALGAPITSTPAIAPATTTPVTINNTAEWSFDVANITNYILHAQLTFAGDTVPANNLSNNLSITVYPASTGIVDLMGGVIVTNQEHPLDWLWYHSLSQTIYTTEELGGFLNYGQITQLVFRVFDFDIPTTNVQIYLANAPTTLTSFNSDSDYYPYENFVKVYDAPLLTDGGQMSERDIVLTLGTGTETLDFTYTGGNIVMMMHKTDTNWFDYRNRWYHNAGTNGVNRSLYMFTDDEPSSIDVQNPDPSNLDWGIAGSLTSFPKVQFFIQRTTLGTLSGTITQHGTSNPIPGATVFVTNYPNVCTETATNGAYILAGFPITYGISISAFGYSTIDIPANSIDWNASFTATQNIAMQPLPTGLSISGRVRTSDYNLYTNDVSVTITGYTGENLTTTATFDNIDGYYVFNNLYGEQTYTITATHTGFSTEVNSVALSSTSITAPDITLTELIRPPHNVSINIDPTNQSQAIVSWFNPLWGNSSFSYARAAIDDGIGNYDAQTFTVAHRYTPAQLETFGASGYDIYKVSFIPNQDNDAKYTIKIWVTDNQTLAFPKNLNPVLEVAVPSVTPRTINEVVLPTFVSVPQGCQLFVGYEVSTPGGYPAGIDNENHIEGYGNLLQQDGLWQTLTENSSYLTGSWCIYVHAVQPENPNAPYPALPVILSSVTQPNDTNSSQGETPTMLTASNTEQPLTFGSYYLGQTPNRVARSANGEFQIFRMLSGVSISTTPLYTTTSQEVNFAYRNMQYVDTSWGILPDQLYKYAVRTKYVGSEYEGGYIISQPQYSNNLLKSQLVSVTVNVIMQTESVAGAIVSLTNTNPNTPNQHYQLVAEDNGSHTFTVYMNIAYTVAVTMAGSPGYTQEHLFTSTQNTLNVNLLSLDALFTQSFHGDQPIGWVTQDTDEDGYFWGFRGFSYNPITGPEPGSSAAYSLSLDAVQWVLLYPDNWLISPPITLPTDGFLNLSFLVSAVYQDFPNDRLLVYIAPETDSTPSWQTFLVNRSLINGGSGSPEYEVLQTGAQLLTDHTVQSFSENNGFYPISLDITSFAGQTVRIAYRHAFCEFIYGVKIANMVISKAIYTPITVRGSVVNDTGAPLSEATVTISSTPTISAITDAAGDFILNNVPGQTTYTITASKYGYSSANSQITVTTTPYTVTFPIEMAIITDLGITSLSGPTYYGPSNVFIIDVHNYGGETVEASSYTIQYYLNLPGEPPQTLGAPISDTPSIASNTTAQVIFNQTSSWGFNVSNITQYEISAVLVYSQDQYAINNTSNPITISVYPNEIGVADLMYGSFDRDYAYPINWNACSSISQIIYTAEELGGIANFGRVTKLTLKADNAYAPDINIQIYLANATTTLTTFRSYHDYYPYENFVKVYDAQQFATGEQNELDEFTITLGTGSGTNDFIYEGGNMVVMVYKEDRNIYGPTYWHYNSGTEGIYRSIWWYTDSVTIDVEDPDTGNIGYGAAATVPTFPQIRFFFNREETGTLSGTVTAAGTGAGIVQAKIYLTSTPTIFTETDANGAYTLANTPTQYSVSASAFGYYTQNFTPSQINWDTNTLTATLNVQMQLLPAGLSISGYVKTADNGEGVNDATVILNGYTGEVIATTRPNGNTSGYYIFNNLYGGHSYTVAAILPHFTTASVNVELTDASATAPDITLTEIIIPPHRVSVELYSVSNEAIVSWVNPLWGVTNFSHARAACNDGIGTNSPMTFTVAHRYTSAQIASFGATDYDIFKVGFIPWDFPGATYTVMVWVTSNSNAEFPTGLNPVVSIPIPEVTPRTINEVFLPHFIAIPAGGQIFVGYEIVTSGGYPAGIDYENHLNGYGNLMNPGGSWVTLLDLNPDLVGSWCIYVTAIEPENYNSPYPPTPVLLSTSANPATTDPLTHNANTHFIASDNGNTLVFNDFFLGSIPNKVTRALNGEFEIYRIPFGTNSSSTPIHTTTSQEISMAYRNIEYQDTNWNSIPEGQYQYAVKTKYAGSLYQGGYHTSEPRYSNYITKATNDADITKPIVTILKKNFPNPFNPSTTIAFDTHKEGIVAIDVFNIKGQKVKTLLNEFRTAGNHKIVWNGQDDNNHYVSSGIYFYRMKTGGYTATNKMLLMK